MEIMLLVLTRLTVVLLIGWLVLLSVRNANPRWTVLVTRTLVLSLAAVPLLVWMRPVWNVAVLPAEAPEASDILLSPQNDTVAPTILGKGADPGNAFVPAEVSSLGNTSELPSESTAAPLPGSVEVETTNQYSADEPEGTKSGDAVALNGDPHSTWWLLIGAWCVGTVALLAKVVIGVRRTARLISESAEASDGIQSLLKRVAQRTSQRPASNGVRLSDDVAGPCSAGWLSPTILLPTAWSQAASDEDMETVLAHELSHVCGRDSLWDLLSRLCQAVWWFHPLVWFIPRQHRLGLRTPERRCSCFYRRWQ